MHWRKLKKKWKIKIIIALLGLVGTLLTATIGAILSKSTGGAYVEDGNYIINNGNIDTIVSIYENTSCMIEEGQAEEDKRPYTVRETYISPRSGTEGIEYKLICVDSKMVGTYYITYYTYDVTYY